MTYGIETYRSNGSVAMTGSNKSGIFIEVLSIAYSDPSGSKTYTQIPAGSMYILPVSSGGQFTLTIGDDGSGHAKLIWTSGALGSGYLNSTAPTSVLVFAKKVNQTTTYGILVNNDGGDQLTDYTYPVPQYAVTLQPSASANRSWYCPDGNNVASEHTVVLNTRTTTHRMVVVNLPDSTSSNIWYACSAYANTGASITLTLLIVRPRGATFQVPTLHVFSLDGPISGGGTYGMQYFNASGSLVYDSSAENVSISDTKSIGYLTTTQNYTMTLPSQPGLSIPFFEQDNYHAFAQPDINGNNGYYAINRGLMQRKGSTIYTKFFEVRDDLDPRTGTLFDIQSGVSSGNFTMAVDVSQLSPSSVTGSPVLS